MAEGVVIKIDGDASGFRQSAEDTQRMIDRALSGVSKGAMTASSALDGVAKNAGVQSAAMANVLNAVGTGADASIDKLMELGAKADLADEKLTMLRGRADEMRSALESAQAAAQQSADALKLLQESADASAENIAYLNTAMQSGNMSAQEYIAAKDQVSEFETELKALNAEIAKQQQINTKATASVQQLSKQYADLTLKVSGAEIAATSANGKLESMAQSLIDGAEASGDALGSFDTISKQSGKNTVALGDMLDDLASGAFNEVSQSALTAVRGMDSFGGSTVIVSAVARGLQSVLRGLIGGAGGYLALGGAVAYALYQIYDFTSGAREAREALEAMQKTADEWANTEAKTIYDTGNDPFERMGVSEDDFKGAVGTTRSWFDRLTETWSDGKRETDDIVKSYVDEFTGDSDSLRKAIEDRQEKLGGLGVDDTKSKEALEQLDAWDEEIEKLLKKRKNGKLSEKDQNRLDEIVKARAQLEIEYTQSDKDGFDKVISGVETEIARLATLGKPVTVDVFADGMAAAAQGAKDYADALDTSYKAQYAVIQGMEDGTEKEKALSALDEQYKQDKIDAAQKYAETMQKLYKPMWESNDVQEGKQKTEGVQDLLDLYEKAEKAGDTQEMNSITEKLNEMLEGPDKDKIASYLALVEQINQLSKDGMSNEELKSMFPEIDIETMLGGYTSIGEFLKAHAGTFDGLESMFTESLPEEILRIGATLDLDTSAWTTFKDDPKSITATFDTSGSKIEAPKASVEATISLYKEAVNANVMPPSKAVEALIDKYNEGKTVTMDDLKPAVSAFVNEYIQSDNADVSTLKPLINAIISDFDDQTTDAQKEALRPALDALVQKFKETEDGKGSKAALLSALTGYITAWDSTGAVPPTVPTLEPIKVQYYYEEMQKPPAQIGSFSMGAGASEQLETITRYAKELNDMDEGPEKQSMLGNLLTDLQALSQSGGADKINGFLSSIFETLENGGTLSDDTIAQLQSVQDFIEAVDAAGMGAEIPAGIAEGMQSYDFGPDAQSMVSAIEDALDAASDAKTAGANVGQGYANGLSSKLATVIKEAARLAREAINTINKTSENASPSKASRRSGRFVGDGFALGINDRVKDAQAASRALAHAGLGGLNVAGLHTTAMMANSMPASERIDYDRLAALSSGDAVPVYLDSHQIATIQRNNNNVAITRHNRRVIMGYGGKG